MSALRRGTAERFADLLDATDGSGRGDAAAAIAEMLVVADALRAIPAPRMADDSSARIRQRLVAVATVQGTELGVAAKPERAVSWRARRFAAAAVGGLAAVTAVSGVAVAASHSLPGQPFYGLKRAAEHVQLDLARSPSAKGHRELEFAATRLAELRKLGVNNSHAAGLLSSMRTDTSAGQADLVRAARSEHSKAPLVQFDTFAIGQAGQLLALGHSAAESVKPTLTASLTQLHQLVVSTDHVVLSKVVPSGPSPVKSLLTPPPPVAKSTAPPTGGPHPTTSAPRPTSPATHPTTSAPASKSPTSSKPTSKPATSKPNPLKTLHSILPSLSLPPLPLPSLAPSDITGLLSGLPKVGSTGSPGHKH